MIVRYRVQFVDGDDTQRECSIWRNISDSAALSTVFAIAQTILDVIEPLSSAKIKSIRSEFVLAITTALGSASDCTTGAVWIFGTPEYRDSIVIPSPPSGLFDAIGEYAGIRILDAIPTVNAGPALALLPGILRPDGTPAPAGSVFVVAGRVAL